MATETDEPDGLAGALAALATPGADDPHARAMLERIRGALTGKRGEPVRIGRFEIEGVLGRGGMGVVYAARDPNLGRDVAVKVIGAGSADDRVRVLQEARALARVKHAAVVQVYEAEVVEDTVYIAMERVEGVRLSRWLEDTRPRTAEILEVLCAAGEGVAAAHDVAVVHGDLKPDNLLVGPNHAIKVVDFGLARISDLPIDEGSVEARVATPGWTVARAGTPGYMAPEQIRGERADPRSDQFSFCVTLFESLAGQRPFFGATPAELAEHICRGEIDETALRRIPTRLRPPLRRGLAADPAARHPTMAALLARLSRRARWPIALVVAAAMALVLVGVGAWRLAGRPATSSQGAAAGSYADAVAGSVAAVDAAPAAAMAAATPDGGGAVAAVGALAEAGGASSPPVVTTAAAKPAATRPAAAKPIAEPAAVRGSAAQPAAARPGGFTPSRIPDPDSPEMLASVERMNADKAEHAGQAEACLRMLDRALEIAPGPEGRIAGQTRARCEMRAGQCEAGRRRYEKVTIEDGGSASYARQEAARLAEVFCPPTTGDLDDRLARLGEQARSAGFRGDLGQCETLLGVAEAMAGEVRSSDQRKALVKAFGSLSFGFAKKVACDLARRARTGYLKLSTELSDDRAAQAAADWADVQCKPPEPSPFDDRPRGYQ